MSPRLTLDCVHDHVMTASSSRGQRWACVGTILESVRPGHISHGSFSITTNVLFLFLWNNNICHFFFFESCFVRLRLECVVFWEVGGHHEFQCNTDVEECAVCRCVTPDNTVTHCSVVLLCRVGLQTTFSAHGEWKQNRRECKQGTDVSDAD